jgi:hypothetical protein
VIVRLPIGAALLLVTAAGSLTAATSHFELFPAQKGASSVCRSGELHAVPRCNGAGCGHIETVKTTWAFRNGSAAPALALSPDVSWEIRIEGSGCWAAPLIVAAGNDGETKTAFVWPSATIEGDFALPKGVAAPNELQVTAQTDDPHNAISSIGETPLDCSLETRHWRCSLPATAVDIRFATDGFAPEYLWGLRVSPGEEKTVHVPLTRGASVSGRVALADRKTPLGDVAIELRPAGYAATPADERRIAARSRTVKINGRGFFQFSSVAEGIYDVVATKKGWSSATRQVRVGGSRESDAGVLSLPPLARAEVVIDPPLDPKGRRWRIVLNRDAIPMRPASAVADGPAAVDGTWMRDGIEAGKYRLEIYDGDGTAYEHLLVSIQPNGPPVRLQMDTIVVRGTLRAGHEALRATLHFINRRGPGDLTLVSREDGTFAGTFPAAGKYDVEITPEKSEQHLRKQVEIEPGSQGIVRIDIDLPGGVIHGNVVDESGAPATGLVRLYRRGGGSAMSVSTAGDGTFRLIAVEPGDAVLNARSRTIGDSGPMPYSVTEDSAEPVTLTLHPLRTVTMWIVAPSGQPIAGAVVRFSNRFYWHEEVTGPGGDVIFSVPRGINTIDVIIAAAGFPVRLMTLAMSVDMDVNPQVALGSTASRLVLGIGPSPPWPALAPVNTSVGLHWLPEFFASPAGGPHSPNRTPRGFEFDLEPGMYTLCPDLQISSRCIQRTLTPGAETSVDITSWSSAGVPR